jgi:glutaredoxin
VKPTVTLYSRPGCHLCEEARESLQRVQRAGGAGVRFDLEEVDITTDDALHMRYLERIPVVTLDGEEVFEIEVDEASLERLILYREGR